MASNVRSSSSTERASKSKAEPGRRLPRQFDVEARGRRVRIDKLSDPRQLRNELFEKLQAPSHHVGYEVRQTSDVPARPSETVHQFAPDRVGDEDEDNRN